MEDVEPQIISNIVVRPTYTKDGQPTRRWMDALYVNKEKRFETIDYDTKNAA